MIQEPHERVRDDRPLWVRLTHDYEGEPLLLRRWFCGWCYRLSRACGVSRRKSVLSSRRCRRELDARGAV